MPRAEPGFRTGRLVVVSAAEPCGRRRRWLCACDCGRTTVVEHANLVQAHTRSCGCLAVETRLTHGNSKTSEYRAWVNMISRCENPNTPGWARYGGRGIRVCAEWRASFARFFADMGSRPSAMHSLDRIDFDGDYEPANCRWATRTEQARNMCCNRIVSIEGQSMTLAEAVERLGLTYNTVLYRLLRGASEQEALR